jgi:protein CpxP
MVKRVFVAAGVVAALAGGTAIVAAHPPQDGPGVSGPGRGPRGGMRGGFGGGVLPLRGIDLTDAQRDQVRSIMESHKAEFEQVRTKVREGHRALASASNAQTVDEAAIRTASTTLAGAMADEAILQAKVRAEVFGILTAEQQQKLQERQNERRQRKQ